jgi:hypothetical protein
MALVGAQSCRSQMSDLHLQGFEEPGQQNILLVLRQQLQP